MDKILNLDNVDQYNQLYGIKTLHPLVSVVNLNEATRGVDFMFLTQLFRRHAKERNRKDAARIYSGESNRSGKRPYCRYGRNGKPDCLFSRFPISATPVPSVQKTGRMHSE
mgnify:FL=1